MPPDPPRKEGLPKQYPPVMLNYPPVPKFIETPVENNHLGDWSPKKDCCWQLMFRQPVWKPSSESSDSQDGFCTGCRNISHQQQSFSVLQLPRWSFSIKVCYSWVQTNKLMTVTEQAIQIFSFFRQRHMMQSQRSSWTFHLRRHIVLTCCFMNDVIPIKETRLLT